jgi:hypothetical protein
MNAYSPMDYLLINLDYDYDDYDGHGLDFDYSTMVWGGTIAFKALIILLYVLV